MSRKPEVAIREITDNLSGRVMKYCVSIFLSSATRFWEADVLHAVVKAFQRTSGVACRVISTITQDDHLEIAEGLGEDTADRVLKQGSSVDAGGDDNGGSHDAIRTNP